MNKWSIRDSVDLYNISGWSNGYFNVNDGGHAVLTPIGFLAYGWASIPYSIWFGHQWSVTLKYLIDALVYAMVVAATFAWLWPTGG